jgi:hypothetical protein
MIEEENNESLVGTVENAGLMSVREGIGWLGD